MGRPTKHLWHLAKGAYFELTNGYDTKLIHYFFFNMTLQTHPQTCEMVFELEHFFRSHIFIS